MATVKTDDPELLTVTGFHCMSAASVGATMAVSVSGLRIFV